MSYCYPVPWISQKEAAAWRTKLNNKEISAEPSAYQLAALYTLVLHWRVKNSTTGKRWLTVMYFRFVNCPMLSEFTEKLALEAAYVPTFLEPPNSLKRVHVKHSPRTLFWGGLPPNSVIEGEGQNVPKVKN